MIIKPPAKPRQGSYKLRDQALKELGFDSYQGYLRSSLWKQVREMAFKANGRKCVLCDARATQIHHSSYNIHVLVGNDLVPLKPVCRKCHSVSEAKRLNAKKPDRLKIANIHLKIPTVERWANSDPGTLVCRTCGRICKYDPEVYKNPCQWCTKREKNKRCANTQRN